MIFGTGAFAENAHFYFTHDSEHEVVAFTAHDRRIDKRVLLGLPVVPFEALNESHPAGDFAMFVAVGYAGVNRVRADIYEQAKGRGYELATYVCSKATTWPGLEIGDNCFVFEDNTIQPYSCIGNDVVLWSGNHVGHHASIGDHCFITSHVVISGHVKVGRYCFLGVNSTLRDSIEIGEACVIGAGALIMKSTGDREVYAPRRTEPLDRTSDDIRM